MPRTCLILAAILFILLASVTADIPAARKQHKQKLEAEQSDAFKAMKEHVHEMKEELKDSLREKGAAFRTGAKEGETDEKRYAFNATLTFVLFGLCDRTFFLRFVHYNDRSHESRVGTNRKIMFGISIA